MSTERRNEIQWLRAIAAFEVVVCHSDLVTKNFSANSIIANSWYNPVAGSGVELFFIISGYVMAMRAPAFSDWKAFMSSRILRIYPMYWLFTTVVVIVGILEPAWRLGDFDMNIATFARSYLILPSQDFPILGVGWTLEYEMVFYVLVALLMSLGATRGPWLARVPWMLVSLGFIGCVFGPFNWAGGLPSHLFTPYLIAFGTGWLFRCLERTPRHVQLGRLALFGAIVALAVWFGSDWGDRLVFRIGFAAIVFAGFLVARRIFQADNAVNRFAWLAGDASYSTYLCHWLILSSVGKALGALAVPAEFDWSLRLLGCVLSGAVGIAIFLHLEKPLARWLRYGVPLPAWLSRAFRPALR